MATFAALSLRASRATGAARIARLLGAPFSSQAAQMPNQEAGTRLLDPSALQVEPLPASKRGALPPLDTLAFGRTFSDHCLEADWHAGTGWRPPVVKPLEPLQLHPGATALQYGISCFEGMKAYKDAQGHARLFRPEMNMARLQRSTLRLALPEFGEEELLECIKALLRVDDAWIPQERGYSLYLRPFVMGSTPFLGVGPSNDAKLITLLSPVGPYFKAGQAKVRLLIDETNLRAAPGGAGAHKLAGNYAPTIAPQRRAAELGADQCLYSCEGKLSECGAMNMFFLIRDEAVEGGLELVTAPLDGTILPGVTRDSILSLARQWGEFKVSERDVTISELETAFNEGRLVECFGAGTAAVIMPVGGFVREDGTKWELPETPVDAATGADMSLGQRLKDAIEAIQYGEVESPWSVLVN